jgi:hypothetical protein
MITTGNLYIQVYNSSSNKYVELPFNELSIQTFLRSGNFPLTGFLITGDLRLNKKLEMGSIDLGRYNRTYQGHNIGIANNLVGLTGSLWETYPSFNIGTLNYLTSGYNSFNIGQSNSMASNDSSFAIGTSNSISALKSLFNSYQYTLGNDNQLSLSGNSNYVVGQFNNLNFVIVSSKILGDNNIVNTGQYIKIIGDSNLLEKSSYVDSFGDSNIFNNSEAILSVGDVNNISYSTGIFNISKSSNTIRSQNVLIFGNNNSSTDAEDSLVLGKSNTLSGSNAAILIGFNNDIASSGDFKSTIIGYDNNFSNKILNIDVFGDYNSNSGSFSDSFIVGSNNYGVNTSDSNINGSVNAIEKSAYINIFGANNEVRRSFSNSIFGRYNTLSSGINCNIIGDSNSVSGLQNYVFGNNNITRSGDYNSILIGISHEFTGEFKVASVNIASVDSKIEITPTDIKLNSSNRAKFNNENITVASDLNNYLNSSNGLSNSGVFTSYTINDPSYTNLSAQIELQAFAYSGKEDRYYGGFSGLNTSGPNAYNFTGFFRKQPTLYYEGLHSIYGNNYYQASNQNFEILFSRDIEALTGNWIISPKNSLGVLFYNKSTNTGVFPISNWIRTGANGVTGYNPAPTFTYSSSFTGFSPKQKINSSTSYASNYFYNFGIVSYPSTQDDIAVLYGNHTNPKFDPSWLIIDKYSSGVYYINKSVPLTTTPQTGWVATGYMGYTGRNPVDLTNAIFNTGIKISLGTRSGIISSYDSTYGKIYIPFLY